MSITNQRLDKNIKFFGHVSYSKIPEILEDIDLFVMPSICESFGVAAIEAQAMGIPVIASMSGGIPEAIVHNKTGTLVEAKNVEKLEESIIKLIKNPKLRKKMGKAGRQFVLSKYDLQKNVVRMENIYQSLLDKNLYN